MASGAQTLLYDRSGVTVLPAALGAPAGRVRTLEALEADLARGRAVSTETLRWRPESPERIAFLADVRAAAREGQGLRFHGYIGEDAPLEACAPGDEDDWTTEFPILRLSQRPAGAGLYAGRRRGDVLEPRSPDPDGRPANSAAVLIYSNPLGDELPGAREEAERARELFAGAGTHFIGRPLGETEWRHAFESARLILYFGHGKNVSGLPAIPGPEDWLPFVPAGSPGGRMIFFNACLDGGSGGLRTPGHFCIHPICRIADRPAPFASVLLRAWRDLGDPARAFVAAARADRDAGDLRRFVFRMQGSYEAINLRF